MLPVQDRKTTSLHPNMCKSVGRFLVACKAKGFDVRIGETRRTKERQNFLFKQNSPTRWVTNCDGYRALSMHQYGIATDFLLYHEDSITLDWDSRSWRTLYAAVPPFDYGLETIPQELVHLQLKGSQMQVVGVGVLSPGYVKLLSLVLT